jgi:hypothetical protein
VILLEFESDEPMDAVPIADVAAREQTRDLEMLLRYAARCVLTDWSGRSISMDSGWSIGTGRDESPVQDFFEIPVSVVS